MLYANGVGQYLAISPRRTRQIFGVWCCFCCTTSRAHLAILGRPSEAVGHRRGYAGALPFVPEIIGSHWSRHVQEDEVAINWKERVIS